MYRVVIVFFSVIATVGLFFSKSRLNVHGNGQAAFVIERPALGFVQILGDVRFPGVYQWSANMLTIDAINLAAPVGPLSASIPVSVKSYRVNPGDTIRFDTNKGNIIVSAIPTSQRIVLGIPLDINSMNISDFDLLPGIGPVMAQRIVKFRQLNGGTMSANDLNQIEGIGEKRFTNLKCLFN